MFEELVESLGDEVSNASTNEGDSMRGQNKTVVLRLGPAGHRREEGGGRVGFQE